MSLYDKASLVQIPSGTKSGKLYSVLPANGDGDFTHTRASSDTRVNKDGLIESVASGVPRLDYPLIGGVVQSCPALLLEPSRTNLSTNSETFDSWTNGGTYVTANQSVSPDGNTTADQLAKTSSFQQIQNTATVVSGSDYSFSVFVKENTLDRITLRLASGSNDVRKCLDLSDLSVVNAGGNQTGFIETKVEKYPNGWYKYTVVATTGGTSAFMNIYAGRADVVESGNIYIWGAQLELGDYPTSYIPTAGSTVTRSFDDCAGAGTTAEFNDNEGVLFAEIQGLNDTDTGNRYISISDGTATNSILIQFRNSGELRAYNGGTGSANLIFLDTGADLTDNIKIAIQYGTTTGDYKVYVNGVSQTIYSLFSASSISGLNQLRFEYATGSSNFYGKTRQLIVFNEALTDAELTTLTS
jgi:hypothetical protein